MVVTLGAGPGVITSLYCCLACVLQHKQEKKEAEAAAVAAFRVAAAANAVDAKMARSRDGSANAAAAVAAGRPIEYFDGKLEAACVICCDRESSHALVPCGHRCVCEGCSSTLLRLEESSRMCPICRTRCESALRVYV